MQEPGNKIAMESEFNQKLHMASKYNASFEFKTLKKRLLFEPDVLLFPAHHRLYNTFNKNFKLMFEAGLLDFYIRNVQEVQKRKIHQEFEEPFKVLTLEELEAGFVVSLVPLLLALFVFIFEWFVALKDLLIVTLLFKAYFRLKEVNVCMN